MMNRLKRYLITGLLLVIPVFLTAYVLIVIFTFLDGILGRYINAYLKELLGFYIPGLGFLFLFIFIASIGFLANRFIGRKFFPFLEKWFSKLPIIDKIFPTAKHIVAFILAQKEFGFKKVVMVEYPSKGIWSLGFITNEEFKKIEETVNKAMVSVFIPNSPGPLTGYVVFLPKEEVRFVDISVMDAIKIIISGGVYKP